MNSIEMTHERDITDKVSFFSLGLQVVSAEKLRAEKCKYAYFVEDGRKKSRREVLGRVSKVLSSDYEPDIRIHIANVSGMEVSIPGQMFGSPDRLGIYAPSVISVE